MWQYKLFVDVQRRFSNRSGVVDKIDEFAVFSLLYIFVSFRNKVDIILHYNNMDFCAFCRHQITNIGNTEWPWMPDCDVRLTYVFCGFRMSDCMYISEHMRFVVCTIFAGVYCIGATNRSEAAKIGNFHLVQRHFSDIFRRVDDCNKILYVLGSGVTK